MLSALWLRPLLRPYTSEHQSLLWGPTQHRTVVGPPASPGRQFHLKAVAISEQQGADTVSGNLTSLGSCLPSFLVLFAIHSFLPQHFNFFWLSRLSSCWFCSFFFSYSFSEGSRDAYFKDKVLSFSNFISSAVALSSAHWERWICACGVSSLPWRGRVLFSLVLLFLSPSVPTLSVQPLPGSPAHHPEADLTMAF